ncbi:hypothetical protein AAL_02170 [Moelleriella libera RCEF 2490]|uniref:Glycosyltransferase family 31 protein n=1 Tax=Moelleriella libera RCEF 2490 TaxID=1081109 RepID=A0A168F8S1_9HYPO|nr:hypothetical protein AAL_02170 [Moelleriella libera RCEF 2490]
MFLCRGLSALQVKLSHLLFTALVVVVLYNATKIYQQNFPAFTTDVEDSTPVGLLLPEEEYLERLIDTYGLTNFTKWQAWRVQSAEQALDVEPITDIHANFQPHWDTPKTIDLSNPRASDLRATKRMELPIHTSQAEGKLNGSDFLFGISTSHGRIADKDWAILRAWKRWLTKDDGSSNGASLVLMLDNASTGQLDDIDRRLHEAGIDAYVTSTAERTSKARRYYELIRILKTYGATLAASGQPKLWFGVVEDTIFFPSLPYLRERLASYDIREQLYVGIPSERLDWQQDGKSVTTFGGGAIMLTKRAVSIIPKLPCLDVEQAGQPYRAQTWDKLLKQCVKKEAGMDMHVVPAFYSPFDAHYKPHLESHENGMRPLLLHDYQDRYHLDVGMAHLVTDVCGEACFMHHYLFHDNWVVINGVSISHHPDGLTHQHHHHHHPDPAQVGQQGEQESFGATSRTPVSGQLVINEAKIAKKPLDWQGRRDVWRLLDSARAGNGAVWQAYLKPGVKRPKLPESKGETEASEAVADEELDSIIVLIWEKKKHQ